MRGVSSNDAPLFFLWSKPKTGEGAKGRNIISRYMDNILQFVLEHLFEIVTSVGLVSVYMARENRRTIKIDNDRKVMDDLVAHLDRLKAEIADMEAKYTRLLKAKDERIEELEAKVAALEAELEGMKTKRNSKGQFVKKNGKHIGTAMVSQAEAGR